MTQQNACMVEEPIVAARGLASEADHPTELLSCFSLGDARVRAAPAGRTAPAQQKAPAARAPLPAVHGNLAVVAEPVGEDWTEFWAAVAAPPDRDAVLRVRGGPIPPRRLSNC